LAAVAGAGDELLELLSDELLLLDFSLLPELDDDSELELDEPELELLDEDFCADSRLSVR